MILLTGGAGFIGSNILAGLNAMGIEDILVVDNLKNSAKHKNLNDRRFSDYMDKNDLIDNLADYEFEAVIHQGACSSTTESDGLYMMKNNYEYSKKLLDYCLWNNIDFMYASSASVYGNGERGFDDAHSNYFPLNVYAYSKTLFDRYVERVLKKEQPKSQILGLRYFNVYGYQENHKGDMASVPYKFFRSVEAGEKIKLFEGSNQFLRDFIFIEDVIKVVSHFYKNKQSGIYNCGTGKARSFQDIADTFCDLNAKAKIEEISFPTHLEGKYQKFTEAKLDKLRRTGYEEEFMSLEEGLQKYYSQLVENKGFVSQNHDKS